MYQTDFNPAQPTWMHIDFNSCFATIEQQANPFLRGRPIAVAAYDSQTSCILAPSIEAKQFGVRTGMRVNEGKRLCPGLYIMTGDTRKYRYAHHQLKALIAQYSNEFWPKSIDEFIVNFAGYPTLKQGYEALGLEIKQRIRVTIGEWMRVSIGFGPNHFLAKLAASIRKPDGLLQIDQHNYMQIYQTIELEDLNGIGRRNAARLKAAGIYSVPAFYHASRDTIKGAFGSSVAATFWYQALRGCHLEALEFERRSFSSQYTPPLSITNRKEAEPVIMKLTQRTATRMRREGFVARGVSFASSFRDGSQWGKHTKLKDVVFDTADIYRYIRDIMNQCPFPSAVRTLSVSCFDVEPVADWQFDLFGNTQKKKAISDALDAVNDEFGDYTVTLGRMLHTTQLVPDRIAFGKVTE